MDASVVYNLGNRVVNNYLVSLDDGGYVLIDTGYAENYPAFMALSLPFEVIETPGHTAVHISMLKDGILFCGDAAMNGFPSIKRTIIWIEDLEQYKRSWEKMIELNPTLVYPAHGKPFPTSDLKKYQPHLDIIRKNLSANDLPD